VSVYWPAYDLKRFQRHGSSCDLINNRAGSGDGRDKFDFMRESTLFWANLSTLIGDMSPSIRR